MLVTTAEDRYQEFTASLVPPQGQWSVEEYLRVTERDRTLVEYTDGYLEVLPMPTERHQAILLFLYRVLFVFIERIGGCVYVAPLRLRVGPNKFREPDILLMRSADDPRRGNRYWTGADLVVEVVSPDDPQRDLVTKRKDYAEAGIAEYWIVDPQAEVITVLRLEGDTYVDHGVFERTSTATSALFPEFSVAVAATLDAH
jgi:Uma2 family endonuclease